MAGPSTSQQHSYTPNSGPAGMPSASGYDPSKGPSTDSYADRMARMADAAKKSAEVDMSGGCKDCSGCNANCGAKDVGKAFKAAPDSVQAGYAKAVNEHGSFGGGTVFDRAASNNMDVKHDVSANGAAAAAEQARFNQAQAGINQGPGLVDGIGRVGVTTGPSQYGSFLNGSSAQAQQAAQNAKSDPRPEARGAEARTEPKADPKVEAKTDPKSPEGRAEAKTEKSAEAARAERRADPGPQHSAAPDRRPDVKPEVSAAVRPTLRGSVDEELLRASENLRKVAEAGKKVDSVFVKSANEITTGFTAATAKTQELQKAVQGLAQAIAAVEKGSSPEAQRAAQRIAMLEKALTTPSANPEAVARIVKSSMPEVKELVKSATAQVERRIEAQIQNVSKPAPVSSAPAHSHQPTAYYNTSRVAPAPPPSSSSNRVSSGNSAAQTFRPQSATLSTYSTPSRTSTAITSPAAANGLVNRRGGQDAQLSSFRPGLRPGQVGASAGGGFSSRGVGKGRAETVYQSRRVDRVDPRLAQKNKGTGPENRMSIRERLMERANKIRQQLEKTLRKLDKSGPERNRKETRMTPAERMARRVERQQQREFRRQKAEAKLTPAERKALEMRRQEQRAKLLRKREEKSADGKEKKVDASRDREARRRNADKRGEKDARAEVRNNRRAEQKKGADAAHTQKDVSQLLNLLNQVTKTKKTRAQEEEGLLGMLSPMEQRALAKILKKLPNEASVSDVRKALKKDKKKSGAQPQPEASTKSKTQQGNGAQAPAQSAQGKVVQDGQQPSKSVDLNTGKVGGGKSDEGDDGFPLEA